MSGVMLLFENRGNGVAGVGIVEFVIILFILSLILLVPFQKMAGVLQSQAADLAQEIAGTSVCREIGHLLPDTVFYDSRVHRYRHRESGRFVKMHANELSDCPER